MKDIDVTVPGKIFLYPYLRLLFRFKSIYVLAGWDLLFPFNVQGCELWGMEWIILQNYMYREVLYMENGHPVIGIDVAKEFCFYAVLSPTGKTYLEPFKALNTNKGLNSVLQKIKKVEKAFSSTPVIVLESTGHYSNRLVHFFMKNGLKVFLINPLLSHSIKNSTIRKVKTDKVDAEELAKLYFLQDLREYELSNESFENLKVLSRTYFHLSEQRVKVINQLVASIEQVMPSFTKIFSNVSSKTAIALLVEYPSPEALLDAPQEDVITLIRSCSRKSLEYAAKKYSLLVNSAKEAKITGILLSALYATIRIHAKHLQHINKQLNSIDKMIKEISIHIPEIDLLTSIPGIGDKLAAIIAGEIGSIDRFKNAKQLVAYCGIDPSVRQSGNFIGTKNKITKRGSSYIRKALYIAATAAIRKYSNGKCINQVMHDYYQKKIQSKPKKLALGAVMNKLVRIIFSVLKNKHDFVLITPEEQVKMHRSNMKIAA